MSLSETDAGEMETLTSPAKKAIVTIGEDFYNSMGSYISDDEEETEHQNDCDANSDTSVPLLLNPESSKPPSRDPNKKPSSKQTNSKGQHDSLLLSERSGGSKGSTAKRDKSIENDVLLLSERSNSNIRDHTGYDSLLVSETTDESWRRIANFVDGDDDDDDDSSSISSTPSTPFPQLVGKVGTQVKGADRKTFGSPRSTSPPPIKPLSERIIEVIESPPLVTLLSPDPEDLDDDSDDDDLDAGPLVTLPPPAAPDPGDLDSDPDDDLGAAPDEAISSPTIAAITECSEKAREGGGSDEDPSLSLRGQDIEGVSEIKTQSDRMETNEIRNEIEQDTAFPVVAAGNNNSNDGNYNGSISTTNSLRDNEREGIIPRRWIYDRIDGKVKRSFEEEKQGLPMWRRKPPLFLCLPSPLLGVFPLWFEENFCCMAVGKWGFFGDARRKDDVKTSAHGEEPELNTNTNNGTVDSIANNNENATNARKTKKNRRTLVMGHALLLNACGLLATILSGLAMTRSSSSFLVAAPFGKTTVIPTVSNDDSVGSGDAVNLYLGLLALGIDNPKASVTGIVVVGFTDFCITPGIEQFLPPADCSRCADVSIWVVLGFLLATIAYLPIFTIGISRLYSDYDSNCSKVTAGIWSVVSLSGYLLVLSCYMSCLGTLYEGEILYTREGAIYEDDATPNDPGEQILRAEFEWKMGVGQILFLIGLVLKIVDFASNCCIATPSITRSRELQWDYEEGLYH